MLDNFSVVGISFQSLPVACREDFSLSEVGKQSASILLKDAFGLEEVVCLYTCNRIEYYFVSDHTVDPTSLFNYLTTNHEVSSKIKENIYHYNGAEACRHLFKVACGLKSLVIGETGILHQLKLAYQRSKETNCVGKIINSLFQNIFKVSKDVHCKTKISQLKRSVSSIGVDLIEQISPEVNSLKYLILGTGETALLAWKALEAKGVKSVVFTSRTAERANEWSEEMGMDTIINTALNQRINEFDVVIGCADCIDPILKKSDVLIADSDEVKKMILIDLGVPRNIDSSLGELEGVVLRNIDDLKDVMHANDAVRKVELVKAKEIIEVSLTKFQCKLKLENLYSQLLVEANINMQIENEHQVATKHSGGRAKKVVLSSMNRIRSMAIHSPEAFLASSSRALINF